MNVLPVMEDVNNHVSIPMGAIIAHVTTVMPLILMVITVMASFIQNKYHF